MPSRKKDRRAKDRLVDDDRRGSERRQSQRILVDLEVDYQCEDTFLFAYITDMSAFGIFIRTNNPESPGTHLNLRFKLPTDGGTMALEGKVIWINAFRPGDFTNINPGMGVKFVDLSESQKTDLLALIRTFAYLEDTEDTEEEEEEDDDDDDDDEPADDQRSDAS